MTTMFRVLPGFLAVLSLGLSNTAFSQDSAGSKAIEEVVVTATRRSESLQDVSGSVSALTNQDLMIQGFDDLQGFARTLPGVALHQPLQNRSTFTIRGLNTDIGDTQLTQEPVSLYINDMPATNPSAELVQPDLGLYDVERIEVLRGPQGTLFGSGSIGGTVRIITRQPVMNEFEASVRMDIADVSDGGTRQRYDGMVNIPLVDDTLALRAVGYVRDQPGWVTNQALGLENSSDEWGGRVALLWHPSDRLTGRFEILHQDSDPEDGDAWNPALGQYQRSSPISEGREVEMTLYNATFEYDFPGFATFMSSTNYKDVDTVWNVDLGTIPGLGEFLIRTPSFAYESFVQEFRLTSNTSGPLEWVTGLFYFDVENFSAANIELLGLRAFVESILGPGSLADETFFFGESSGLNEELAVYGDVTWQASESWSFSAGLRFFETESAYIERNGQEFDFATLQVVSAPSVTNRADDNSYTWRLVAAYTPDENQHYYLNVARGYRVGQVNPQEGPSLFDPNDVVISPAYDPDETLSVELGAKTSWMDGRLRLNVALYTTDWTDIQIDAVRSSDQASFIANAGDATSEGVEIELRALPVDGLDLGLNLTWQDAEIDSITEQNAFLSGARPGDVLPGTADFLGSGMAQYTWDAFGGRQMRALLAAQYVDSSPNRFSFGTATGMPNRDFAINESYTNVNASLSLVDDEWEVTLYGENLTDNDDAILNIGATRRNPVVSLQPRTIGVRLSYWF